MGLRGLLGVSWVDIIGFISRMTIVIAHIGGFIALLITTHEPPSKPQTKNFQYPVTQVSTLGYTDLNTKKF